MVAWRRRHLPRLWMKTWKRRHSLSPRMKEAHGWNVDLAPWDTWSMRCRKECWLPLSPPLTFGSSWPNLLLGLVKPNFINLTTHCLTYYSRKTRPKQWPKFKSILLPSCIISYFRDFFSPCEWCKKPMIDLIILWEAHVNLSYHASSDWALMWAWACWCN